MHIYWKTVFPSGAPSSNPGLDFLQLKPVEKEEGIAPMSRPSECQKTIFPIKSCSLVKITYFSLSGR